MLFHSANIIYIFELLIYTWSLRDDEGNMSCFD